MKNNTLVSLIVPIFNVEKFLRICIDSILKQTYSKFELLLIDDGSTDKSGEIADEYAKTDCRIRVIHKSNKGVSAARNTGLQYATGEYVCFADADDILQVDYISYLVSLIQNYHADVALTTRMYTTFDGGSFPIDTLDKPFIVSGETAVKYILYYHIPIGCYSKMFKRSLIEKSVKFNENIFVGEGFNFNVDAFINANNIVISNRRIYCYRRDNPTSCMTEFKLSKCQMALEAIQIIQSKLKNFHSLQSACDFAYWHTAGDMYNWILLAKVQKKYLDEYKLCWKAIKSYSWRALFAPINKKERFRAFIQCIHPKLLVFLLEFRRWKAISFK